MEELCEQCREKQTSKRIEDSHKKIKKVIFTFFVQIEENKGYRFLKFVNQIIIN